MSNTKIPDSLIRNIYQEDEVLFIELNAVFRPFKVDIYEPKSIYNFNTKRNMGLISFDNNDANLDSYCLEVWLRDIKNFQEGTFRESLSSNFNLPNCGVFIYCKTWKNGIFLSKKDIQSPKSNLTCLDAFKRISFQRLCELLLKNRLKKMVI